MTRYIQGISSDVIKRTSGYFNDEYMPSFYLGKQEYWDGEKDVHETI